MISMIITSFIRMTVFTIIYNLIFFFSLPNSNHGDTMFEDEDEDDEDGFLPGYDM